MTEEIHSAYQRLELPIGANLPQVQKAWREMVTVWHPDRFPNNPDLQRKAEERTKQINNAYDILKRYLKDGDIPRSRPRASKQTRKQESEKQNRQSRSRPRPSSQSQKQESQQRTRQTRSHSSKQSKKRESQKRNRQQETASEDAQSSQTHEEENRQEQTTKPPQEESFTAKNGGIVGIIFGIIFSGVGGCLISMLVIFIFPKLFKLIDWMIEAVSGWSLLDSLDSIGAPLGERFSFIIFDDLFIFVILVSLIVTFFAFFGRIIDTEEWFGYTIVGVFSGMIGGMVCGLLVHTIGNVAISTNIAAGIGAAVGAHLACLIFSEDELKREK